MHRFVEIARHFLRRLWRTPLLLGWLVLGPLAALWHAANGRLGFILIDL